MRGGLDKGRGSGEHGMGSYRGGGGVALSTFSEKMKKIYRLECMQNVPSNYFLFTSSFNYLCGCFKCLLKG